MARRETTAKTLADILVEPQTNASTPPETFTRVIQGDAVNEGPERKGALGRS